MVFLIIISLIIMSISFLFVFISTPFFIKFLKEKGYVGKDVHKKDKPEVAEMGGTVLLSSFIISFILLSISSIFYWPYFAKYIAGILSLIVIASIGFFDDYIKRKKNGVGLGAKTKAGVCMAGGLPIFIMYFIFPHIIWPYLRLPFLGAARMFIIYPFLVMFAYTVCANTTNMIDVYNGTLPGTSIIIFIALLISSIIVNSEIGIILCLTFLGTLLGYYYYNKNPARIFSGDIGSLLVGGSIAFTIIMANLEVIGIIALLPLIINAFQTLRSIGGFKEKSEFSRPTIMLETEQIDISKADHVPLTLAGLILVKGPLKEKEIFNCFMLLTLISSLLAIFTTYILILPW